MRAGHELDYYPGETNLRGADILVINKVSGADEEDIAKILALKAALNPAAQVMRSDLAVTVDQPELLQGKRVLVVEDGPSVTHGGMSYGAGWVAAQQYAPDMVVDPAPHAVGSIRETLDTFRHLYRVLPAMGYSQEQRAELKATIENSDAQVVINASPADIAALLDLSIPVAKVSYQFAPVAGADILAIVRERLGLPAGCPS